MKYDPKKLFGYPVLRDTFVGEDKTLTDYPKSEFQPDISLKRDPKSKSKAIIDYEIAMSVPELIKKIDDGDAGYRLHISCPRTFWSATYEVSGEGSIEFDATNIRDEVELSIVLIATRDFDLYSEKFHEDFNGEVFPIKANAILAWHNPFVYSAENEQFRSLRSLIDIATSPDYPEGYIGFDGDGDYVTATINPKMKDAIGTAWQGGEISRKAVLASFYQSVVTHMLFEMILSKNETGNIGNQRWRMIIDQTCARQNIVWDNPNMVANNAQTLLGNCMKGISAVNFGVQK